MMAEPDPGAPTPQPPADGHDSLPSNRLTAAFERRVAAVLDRYVESGARLVLACSGGPDSTAALVAVTRARGAERVTAACYDHRLRPDVEVEAERAVVADVSARLGVHAVFGTGAPAGGGEAAAREARYGWLAAVCRQASAQTCVTGHTLDDQAETVLLRLVRGSGLPGASAMAPDGPWPLPEAGAVAEGGPLRLVRPLLACSRDEVVEYLDALGQETREDPSNELVTFDRNRIRHRVLPELRRLNPRATERLAAFAELARADDDALQAWAGQVLESQGLEAQGLEAQGVQAPRLPGAAGGLPDAAGAGGLGASVHLDRAVLRGLPPAVASRVVRLAGERVGLVLDQAQTEQVLRGLGRRGARTSLAGGEATTEDAALVIRRWAPAPGR